MGAASWRLTRWLTVAAMVLGALSVIAPPASAASYHVAQQELGLAVTTLVGTSTTTTADQFSYLRSSAPVISAVGRLTDVQGDGVSSVPVSPKNRGDALVLTVKVSSATATVTSVTGGGATAWARLVSFSDNASHDLELWLGTVSTTGASSVTVRFSSPVGSRNVELTVQEFTAGLGPFTLWAKDAAAGRNNASSGTIASPPLTPHRTGELYFGYSRSPGKALAGNTPGFTYERTADGNVVLFDPRVSAAVAPKSTQSPANTSSAVGALIEVSAGPKPPGAAVLSAYATPNPLPSVGGHVTVTGRVEHATSCQLKLLSHQSFPVVYSDNPTSCTSGAYSADLVIGANPSPVRRTVAFALVASNETSSSTGRFYVALLPSPPTSTTTTTTSPPTTTTTVPRVTTTTAPTTTTTTARTTTTTTARTTTTTTARTTTTTTARTTTTTAPTTTTTAPTTTTTAPTTTTTRPVVVVPPPAPTVVSAHATPSSLPSTGGHITVTGKVKHANSCQLKLLSRHSFPVVYSHNPKSCTTGGYSAHLVIKATPSPVRRNITFALVASNKTSSSTVRFSVVLLPSPPTTTTTTTTTVPQVTTTTAPTTTTTLPVVVSPPPTAPPTSTKTSQTISFTSTAPSNPVVGGTYTPTATATSGLTVTITIDATASSVCTISGGLVTFNATGDCVIDANQAGNGTYSAAPQVQQTVVVGKTSQTISFTSTPPSNPVVGGTYTPTATATSGLTVTITIDATASSVCTISGSLVTFNATGDCVIDANQAGNGTYSAAPQVQQTVVVGTTISEVGALANADYPDGGTATGTTLAVDPQNDGDVLVVCVDSYYFASGLSSLSGGGVTTWTKGEQFLSANSRDIEIWFGTVTATGTSTITFNWPVDITGDWTEYTAQEFSAPGAVWSLDKGGKSDNTSSSTTVTYPALTPSGTAELYYGYAGTPGSPSIGSTLGFSYGITDGGIVCYDTDVSGTVSPTASQSPTGVSEAAAVLLTASA